MPRSHAAFAFLSCAALVLTACQSAPSSRRFGSPDLRPHLGSLVTSGDAGLPAAGSLRWEQGRNDLLLGNLAPAVADEEAVVYTYDRDRTRTIDGRAFDHSSSTTYTYRRRVAP
jgi:hypothetical protein